VTTYLIFFLLFTRWVAPNFFPPLLLPPLFFWFFRLFHSPRGNGLARAPSPFVLPSHLFFFSSSSLRDGVIERCPFCTPPHGKLPSLPSLIYFRRPWRDHILSPKIPALPWDVLTPQRQDTYKSRIPGTVRPPAETKCKEQGSENASAFSLFFSPHSPFNRQKTAGFDCSLLLSPPSTIFPS